MKLPDAVCGRVRVRPAGSSERGTHQLWISLFIKVHCHLTCGGPQNIAPRLTITPEVRPNPWCKPRPRATFWSANAKAGSLSRRDWYEAMITPEPGDCRL